MTCRANYEFSCSHIWGEKIWKQKIWKRTRSSGNSRPRWRECQIIVWCHHREKKKNLIFRHILALDDMNDTVLYGAIFWTLLFCLSFEHRILCGFLWPHHVCQQHAPVEREGGRERERVCVCVRESTWMWIDVTVYTLRVYVYICIHTYVCTASSVCTSIYIYKYIYLYMILPDRRKRICIYIYADTCIHTYVYTCMFIHVYIHIYMYMYIYTYIYTFVYIHIYMYVYIIWVQMYIHEYMCM